MPFSNGGRPGGVATTDQPHGDCLTSLDRSISVSLDSNVIKATPESLPLLSLISYFPTGVRKEMLAGLASSLDNPEQAILALQRTSLIYFTNEETTYRVLTPIQAFIRQRHPIGDGVFDDVLNYYCNYLHEHNIELGEAGVSSTVKAYPLKSSISRLSSCEAFSSNLP